LTPFAISSSRALFIFDSSTAYAADVEEDEEDEEVEVEVEDGVEMAVASS
jgi:hypothetical protein